MKNKDFLRRAAAFAVSLSFISYSGMADICSFEAADSENATAPVTTSTTPVTQTTEVTTEPVTSAATTVTTEATNYFQYDLEIDKNIDVNHAKLIVNNIFGSTDDVINNSENEKSGDFSVKIKKTVDNADIKLDDFINKNNNIKSIVNSNNEQEKYIVVEDQCYYISKVTEKTITLQLCLYLKIDNNTVYNALSGELSIDDKFKISTVMKFDYNDHQQYCVRAKNTIKCSGIKGWNITDKNSDVELDISPKDGVDHYINLECKDNKITFTEKSMPDSDGDQGMTKELTLEEGTVQLNVSGTSDNHIAIQDNNNNDITKSSSISWSNAKCCKIKIDDGYTYDVYVYVKNDEKSKLSVINDYKVNYELNFENDQLNKFLYKKDVVIDIEVRPKSISIDTVWNDSTGNIENNTTKVSFSVSWGNIAFPYLKRKDGDTYYLSRIEKESDPDIEIRPSEIIQIISDPGNDKLKNMEKKIEFKNNRIKRVIYTKINNADQDESQLKCYNAKARNSECRSIKKGKDNAIPLYIQNEYSYIIYNILQLNFLGKYEYINAWSNCADGFSITKDDKFIQIISILKANESNELSEIKLDTHENIYVDTVKPIVSEATVDSEIQKHKKQIKTEDGSNHTEYWSNNTYDFSVCVSDIDEDLKQYEEIDKIVNTPSDNCSEISSVDIGGYVFTNNNGKWENTKKPAYSEYTVSITSVKYNKDKKGFDFNISVALNEDVDIFNDNIEITATDNCDNISDCVTVNILIDKTAPEFNGMDIQTVVANAGKAMAVLTKTDAQNKTKTAGVDVTADIIDSEYVRTIIKEIADTTQTEASEDGTAAGKAVSIVKSTKPESGSGIKNVIAEYITDNVESVSEKCSHNINTYTAYLDCGKTDKIRNSNGIIKITAEDYAGNKSEYYYHSATADLAKKIIIDTENPQCSIEPRTADYIERDGKNEDKKWYNAYPSIPVKACDQLNQICSGLKTLNFSVNGQAASVDITKSGISINELQSGKYEVRFALNEGIISASLTNGTNIVPLIAEINPDPHNNYRVTFTASDYSGNESPVAETSFYIDITPPKTAEVYQIENEKTQSAYGNFSNDRVKIKVRVYDEDFSSGLKQAVLNCFGKEYPLADAHIDNNSADGYNRTYIFTVPGEDISDNTDLTGNIDISVTDNVGNTTVVNKLKSEKGSDLLTIEKIPPKIGSPEITGENHYLDSSSGNNWYSSDVTVTYGVNDEQSGIKQIDYRMYQDHNVLDQISKDYTGGSLAVNKDKYTLKTVDNKDGRFDFSVDVTDNCGNTNNDYTLSVYKDTTSPVINSFDFEDGIIRQWKDIISGETDLNPFGFFNDNDAVVTVYAKDDNASSGIRLIHVDLINSDGSLYTSYDETVTESDKNQSGLYSKRFSVPEGFKGTIQAYAEDNVNNVSETNSPNGYVSENGDRHISTSGLHITLPSTEYKDISRESLPLYAGDVTSKISVDDSYSGISKVEWNTSDFKNDEWHQINIDASGNISGDDASEWKIISTDRNLVTAIERNITVSANMNNDHIVVRTTDNSGNVSQTEEHFSIDKSVPAIELKWNNTTSNNYYNADRTVSVSVNERNFNGADIKINDRSQALDFKLVSGAQTEGTDNAVYRAEYTFSSDGEFELSADCTDMCGNKAQNVKSGKFIVDKTKPVLNVSFTDAAGKPVNASNSKYYSSAVNAVITATETNFNSSLVAVNINGEKKNDCSWKDNGNVHTTTVPFNNDGEYELKINGSDIAGNILDAYSYSFCIDKSIPSIEFGKTYDVQSGNVTEGMRPADNSSEISPVIVINDKNLNPDNITISLQSSIHDQDIVLVSKGNVKNDEYLDTNECYYDSKSGKYVISLYDIQEDDIYDLTVDAYDMSGNKGVVGSGKSQYLNKTDSGIKFSVNRNGSTFELAEDTQSNVNKKYLQKPKNVSIREVNVNEHSDDPDILIHKDIENQTDPDVKFTENQADGFVEYIYDLADTNFEDLAKYSVDVLSSDIAGNKNSSSAVKEKNSEDFLSFWVDSEQPECSLLNVQSDEEYSEAQMQCRVQITDNIEVDTDSIKIMLDGSAVDYKLIDTNVYAFNIDASNKERTIQVNCSDMAQNTINQTVAEHFMVSKNPFVIFFHKKIVKMLTALIGATAVISGAAITIFRRKRRVK